VKKKKLKKGQWIRRGVPGMVKDSLWNHLPMARS